jgi:hypothetical protein
VPYSFVAPCVPSLFDIFKTLRETHRLPLGIDEYLTILQALRGGFGLENCQELEQLCCLVWATSEAEQNTVRRELAKMWRQIELRPPQKKPESTPTPIAETETQPTPETPTPEAPPVDSPPPTPKPEATPEITPTPEPQNTFTVVEEPVQTVQAIRDSAPQIELPRPRYALQREYFPVTRREMKQCWRYLRRPLREGAPTELDVEATVEKIGREGILLEPVLVPRRVNRTDLVMLVDVEGSMVPFHGLSRQLVETAQRGGRLRQTRVYYFHDYPDRYLYRHPGRFQAQLIEEVWQNIGERAVVLIISDAGAARRNYDEQRVKATQEFIEQLQRSVRYFAWLNPMPSEDWQQNTAGEIARFVPMFGLSLHGLNRAIAVLQGRSPKP